MISIIAIVAVVILVVILVRPGWDVQVARITVTHTVQYGICILAVSCSMV